MDIKKLIDIASGEILNPTFELTKQYLNINKIKFNNSKPIIEDITFNNENETAELYFPIIDEKYYFVIYLDLKPVPKVRWMGTSAGNDVCLTVNSETHYLDELLNIIDINPIKTWRKGEINETSNVKALYKTSGFIFRTMEKRTGEVEDKLRSLIDILLPYKEKLIKLTKIATVEISIYYSGYKEEMWGLHFKPDLISKLSELNLSLDIDLYAS